MMSSLRHRFAFLFFFGLVLVQRSQSQDTSWIITIATGDTLSHCSLISLDGDSLKVSWSGVPFSLPVESIRKLQHVRPSEFWNGAFYGASAGALAGTLIRPSGQETSAPTAGILGAACGLIVGGFAADYISRDDRYDLSRCNLPEKKTVLGALLLRPDVYHGENKLK